MKDQAAKNKSSRTFNYFEKASGAALNTILNALNAEVDAAVAQRRFPQLDGALKRICPAASQKNPM